jgi:hypothetical protein
VGKAAKHEGRETQFNNSKSASSPSYTINQTSHRKHYIPITNTRQLILGKTQKGGEDDE